MRMQATMDGDERVKHEGEIRALIIGGGEAAPDPWPDAVRSASAAPDLDAARRVLVDADALLPEGATLPAIGADEEAPKPVIWTAESCTVRRWLVDGWLPVGRSSDVERIGVASRGNPYIALAIGCCGGQGGGAERTRLPGKPADLRGSGATRR